MNHGAPGQRLQAVAQQFIRDDAARLRIQEWVTWQKQHTHGNIAGPVRALANAFQLTINERVWDRAQDAGAIAASAIGVKRTTVSETLQAL
jgi:hypothetical protein